MNKFLLVLLTLPVLAGCAATPNRSDSPYSRNTSQPRYVQSQSGYVQSQPVYAQQPSAQSEANKKIIKQGLLGAATGAIAAEASGGKAGKGALIGAGTNVIGGALFDMLTAPQPRQQVVQQNPQYAPYVDQWQQQNQGNKKIVRKYDSDGKIVSEEEVWQ